MLNDYLEIENAEGMPNLADATFALDFLLTAKNTLINWANAITEVVDPAARTMLRNQLQDAIDLHAMISELMIRKGWLHSFELRDQFELDRKSAEMAMKIAGMQLFPDYSGRLGTFATPHH